MATFWTLLIVFLCLVQFENLPSVGVKGADKYVHFTFHFVFTLLWSTYFFLLKTKVEMKSLLKILFISVTFGVVIELLQGEFTTTRQADSLDVLANFFGASIAVIGMLVFKYINENKN